MQCWMVSQRRPGLSGLGNHISTPDGPVGILRLDGDELLTEKTLTPSQSGLARMERSVSGPSQRGIDMSRRIKSGR